MLVLIVSDIHDNLPNLQKCLDLARRYKIQDMVCCGDMTNSETLKYLAANFAGDIYLVRGNIEIYDEVETNLYQNIKYLGRFGLAVIDNKNIGICHEPDYIKKVIDLAKSQKTNCDIVFYGHTHRPWSSFAKASSYAKASADKSADKEDKRDGVRIVNPGTVAGTFSQATCAIWDTASGKIELKLLDSIG